MEVTADDTFDFGVSWQGGGKFGASGDETLMFGTGNAEGLVTNVDSATKMLGGTGVSFGVLSLPFSYDGKDYFSLGAFVQASQTNSDVNIISTPQLMTLENEEAKVVIAENRAYQTSNTVSDGDQYENYEYKDIGVTLKVTPQINDRGSVKMKIFQEASRVDKSVEADDTKPTTRKRQAETTVEVADGQTVVIAGLIEDSSDDSISKVPLLGDIPILGWLFKTKSTSNSKKNMFVFITPHVVNSPEDSRKVFLDKMKLIESVRYDSHGRIEPIDKPMYVAGPMAVR
jgi:general secretion pathway protein D